MPEIVQNKANLPMIDTGCPGPFLGQTVSLLVTDPTGAKTTEPASWTDDTNTVPTVTYQVTVYSLIPSFPGVTLNPPQAPTYKAVPGRGPYVFQFRINTTPPLYLNEFGVHVAKNSDDS